MTLPLSLHPASADPAAPLRRIRSTARRTPLDLGELWRYRDLWLTLALRDVKLRYRQTALGVAWVVLLPLLASGIFTLVFGVVAKLPTDGSPYFLFVFAGYLGWNAFQNTLQRCGISLIGNTALVTKVYFPRIILPAASVLASLLDFAVGVVMLLVVLLVRGEAPSVGSLALVPLFMLLLQLLGLGVGFFSAALTVRFRDVQYVLPFLIQLLLYASPVAYGITAVPPAVRRLYLLNPVAPLLDGLRTALLGRGELHWLAIGGAAAVSAATFALGTLFFLYQDRQYADVI
ncbi:MAG TPA: ABC transporter permease [Gemmatimonadaceae bacterium]|jgi:lipopolysaccharide transport system permease protein|nr:ABC transporter permease [Gemmatimonadaceae bacterium]